MMTCDDDREAMMDRAVFRERDHLTTGTAAVHGLTPAEILERMEEAARRPETLHEHERMALRVEILSGLLEYLFADGPAPCQVQERLEGAFRSFCPELHARIQGPREWVSEAEVARILAPRRASIDRARAAARSRGALSTWWADLEDESDRATVVETISGLLAYWVSEGRTWRLCTSVAWCIAKALRPQLIGGMSLDDIARLSGDSGGRATPSDRIRRLYNRRVEAAGMLGSTVHFQKSPSTCARYAEAQVGNRNRASAGSKTRRRRRKTRAA